MPWTRRPTAATKRYGVPGCAAWAMRASQPKKVPPTTPKGKVNAKARAWQQATAVDVQNFLRPREGQLSGHQPGRRISEVTRRRYWRLLERIYDHALDHGWVSANPAAGLAPQERPLPKTARAIAFRSAVECPAPPHSGGRWLSVSARPRHLAAAVRTGAGARGGARPVLARCAMRRTRRWPPCQLHIDGARARSSARWICRKRW